MKLRKVGRTAAAVALSAGIALGAAACGGDTPTDPTVDKTESRQETPADPKEAVVAAVAGLSQESYSVEITMGDLLHATGRTDPATSSSAMSLKVSETGEGTLEFDTITIGQDAYVLYKGDLAEQLPPRFQGVWMHTTVDDEEYQDINHLDMSELMTEDIVLSAEETGDGVYAVKLDPAMFDDDFGDDGVKELDAVVTLTDDGRLASIEIVLPEVIDDQDQTMVMTFSGHGEPVDIETPSDAHEMSEIMIGG